MSWGRLSIGLALAGVAGVTFGCALAADRAAWWCAGGATLTAAVLFILSGFYAPRHSEPVTDRTAPRMALPEGPPTAPLLGELLVRRTLLNRGQLEWALAQQRGTSRLLGSILVELRLITQADLSSVLKEQRAVRDGRYVWRGA